MTWVCDDAVGTRHGRFATLILRSLGCFSPIQKSYHHTTIPPQSQLVPHHGAIPSSRTAQASPLATAPATAPAARMCNGWALAGGLHAVVNKLGVLCASLARFAIVLAVQSGLQRSNSTSSAPRRGRVPTGARRCSLLLVTAGCRLTLPARSRCGSRAARMCLGSNSEPSGTPGRARNACSGRDRNLGPDAESSAPTFRFCGSVTE